MVNVELPVFLTYGQCGAACVSHLWSMWSCLCFSPMVNVELPVFLQVLGVAERRVTRGTLEDAAGVLVVCHAVTVQLRDLGEHRMTHDTLVLLLRMKTTQ